MIGSMEHGSTSQSTSACNVYGTSTLQAKHKVFLSHSGAQKGFVEQLCVDLERCDRRTFFDKRQDSLPIGEDFVLPIFEAIEECDVGVMVLSEEFFTSIWPMLELVAMTKVQKRKPSLKIVPVFLGLSLSQFQDDDNHKRWLSLWQSWAESDGMNKRWLSLFQQIWTKSDVPIDFKDWMEALRLLDRTNALKYNFQEGEVSYRKEIVKAICEKVPPETRFEDSHIQGRSRLCKVIHERIKQSQVSSRYGVHVIGLYGFGGIGKTTLCKAMCNDLSEECHGKVAHLELGSESEQDLLKEVLQRLTDMNLERLGAMKVDEYCDHLKRDMKNVKVFLTIDNVSSATRPQALTLLKAKYGHGSVVLVTARSQGELTSLGILESECMEMPELEMEEARSLFLYHAICVPSTYSSNEDDCELVLLCVQRCYFKKGDGISYHYHPLALQVLGEQLGSIGYFPERWMNLLLEIDFFNPFGERQHPVFSILRSSFEALDSKHQLLFMDVALFGPYVGLELQMHNSMKWSIFEWLGMVHKINVTSVKERLENLKRKSLLEHVGDEFNKIGMHDLWREFARLETKVGKFEERQWMFEWDECNASVTNGDRLVNMRRMLFSDKGCKRLEDVSFPRFPKVTVLKLCPPFPRSLDLQLDLSGLKDLMSLELDYIVPRGIEPELKPLISLLGLSSLSKLVFLRWLNIPPSSPCIEEIGRLTNLQVLDLYECGEVPDLSNLLLLQVACFRSMVSVATIVGLSSSHTKLQFLDLSRCHHLQSCLWVGELVVLHELCLRGCFSLEEVPNLKKLIRLQKLDVSWCSRLQGLPGFGDLVSLVELDASDCWRLAGLPNMRNLKNLEILNVGHCVCIKSLPGLNELVCVQSLLMSGCDNLTQLPDMHNLTNLQNLEFNIKWPLQSRVELSDSISLQSVDVGVVEMHDGPDLHKLTMLKRLKTDGWQGQGFSSLAELLSLEFAVVHNCKDVRVLPDLQKLSWLGELELWGCEFEDIFGLSHLTSLETLSITKCNKLEALPDLHKLTRLEFLMVERCIRLRDIRSIVGLQNLQRFQSSRDAGLHENLELNLPQPMKRMRSSGDVCLHENHELDLSKSMIQYGRKFADQQGQATCSQLHTLCCGRCPIQELPDLAYFPKLSTLEIFNCVNLTNLTCTGPLSRTFQQERATCLQLHTLRCGRCPIEELPDLACFPKLSFLEILDCLNLTNLTCTGPLSQTFQRERATCLQLHTLQCKRCPIEELPDLAYFPKLSFLEILDCVNLTNLTCTGPLSRTINHLDVSGCIRLQALPDLTNSREMKTLIVAKSGVVLSCQFIEVMKVQNPSMRSITKEVDLMREDSDNDDIDLITDDSEDDIDSITDDSEDDIDSITDDSNGVIDLITEA